MPVHLRYRVPDVSIHLMLLFIMSDEEIKKQYTEFQYISCYSLSQMKQSDASAFVEFQYISCYSLSLWGPGAPPARQSFQYISCYSLSGRSLSDVIPVFVSIHLMLLFIRASTTSLTGLSAVSIHLMLLFIQRHPEVGEAQQAFQYISCYSLSSCEFSYKKFWNVSIHLMLLFIGKTVAAVVKLIEFQYISCYSLSTWKISQIWWIRCFNTSHVTLYRHNKTGIRGPWKFQYISCYSLSKIWNGWATVYSNVSIHLMLLFICKDTA